MTQRRVVCAANQYDIKSRTGVEKRVFVGVRHFCPIMIENMSQWRTDIIRTSEIQGFVDQYGVFMDRYEALKVANEAGQLNVARTKTFPEDRLFSEDLY